MKQIFLCAIFFSVVSHIQSSDNGFIQSDNLQQDCLSPQDYMLIDENPHITFVYIPPDIKKTITNLAGTYHHIESVLSQSAFFKETNIAPYDDIKRDMQQIVDFLSDLNNRNDEITHSNFAIIQDYLKTLESGDAFTFSKRHGQKEMCSLLVYNCTRTGSLCVCGNAVVCGNLSVSGTISSGKSRSIGATDLGNFIELVFNACSLSSHGQNVPNKRLSYHGVDFLLWELHAADNPESPEPLSLLFQIPAGADLAHGWDVDLHIFTIASEAGDSESANIQTRIRAVYLSNAQAFNTTPSPVNETAVSALTNVTRPAGAVSPTINTNHYVISVHMTGSGAAARDLGFLAIDRIDSQGSTPLSPLSTVYLAVVGLRFPAA